MKKDYNADATAINTPNLKRNTRMIRWAWCSLGVNALTMAVIDRSDKPITGYVILGICLFALAYFKSTDTRRVERNTAAAILDVVLWLPFSAIFAYIALADFNSALPIILCVLEIVVLLLLIRDQSSKHQNRKV